VLTRDPAALGQAQNRAPETAEHREAQKVILEEMRERDRRDRERAESPLRAASDAVVLDSTAMTLEEVLASAEKIVLAHLPRA
jgi:cytidylate kinase